VPNAAYPDNIELVTRTTCDRERTMTVTWCTDVLLDDRISWLLCWNLVRVVWVFV